MVHDFNARINRMGTDSAKWDGYSKFLGIPKSQEILPLWVADMDFKCPEVIIEAIQKRAEHGIIGYSFGSESYFEAVTHWMKRRHKWNIEQDWIVETPGVVKALNLLVRAFTQPGDKVIVQTPVYYPFMESATNNGRELSVNPLSYHDGTYKMDYADLEQKASDPKAKLLILCNPHNPVSRVWTSEELLKLGEICIKHDVIIISDEVHGDIVYTGNSFTPFASLSAELAEHSIICTGPSKTFNIAGLEMSNIIISNPIYRTAYKKELEIGGFKGTNPIGISAVQAAYREGEPWLEDLLEYLQGNIEFLQSYLKEKMPKIRLVDPEGTYLCWLDFSELKLAPSELETMFIDQAKLAVQHGQAFGDNGKGFVRMNIACPQSVLEEALIRIDSAIYQQVIDLK